MTSEQLRALGTTQCPVPGCTRRPEGFKSLQAMRFHLQSHAPSEVAAVPAALQSGGGRVALPQGPFHCAEPGCAFGPGKKTLKNVKTATQHSKSHAVAAGAAPSFSCERCQRTFALKYRLTEHTKTCGSKGFMCKCGVTLAHKSSLKTHVAQWANTAPHLHALMPQRGDAAPDADGEDDGGAGAAALPGLGDAGAPADGDAM